MLKQVLDDYRMGFWTALKNYADMAKLSAYAIYVGVTMLMLARTEDVNLMILTGIVPMLAGLLLARIYPNQMSKIMFLCPMSAKERKCYLKTAYWLRVGTPMALCIISSTAAMALGYIPIFYYLEMNILVFSYLSGINVYCLPQSWKKDLSEDQWTLRAPFAYEVLNMFLQLVGLIGICVFGSADFYGMDQKKDQIAMTVFMLAELLISLKIIVTYYKPVMEHGMNYEDCYLIKRG